MLGFPQRTEIRKLLPKKAIYDKFNLNQAGQNRVDADISRLWFVNEISPYSVGIAAGEEVKAFYVIEASLKRRNYDEKTIAMLFRLIENKMILVLSFEAESRIAVYRGRLLETAWMPTGSFSYTLQGLNLDAVWDNLVMQIGNIHPEPGRTIEEQIAADEQRAKIQREIERLEKLARAEMQPKKKFELAQKIAEMKQTAKGTTI